MNYTTTDKALDYLQLEHPEYCDAKLNWQLVRDLIKGERCLKNHDLSNIDQYRLNLSTNNIALNRQVYLPYTSLTYTTSDLSRYFTYVQRAALLNATQRTQAGLTGMVFSKDSRLDLPDTIAYLGTNADGSGVGILDQAVETVSDLLEVARCGLFVDYPEVVGEISQAEMDVLELRANIIKYKAEDIVDWDVMNYGASQKLSLVKLREHYSMRDPDNIFATIDCCRHRVLLLNSDGIYEQRVYEHGDDYTTYIPTDADGEPLTFIPFFFVGATDNRPDVDTAPLLSLAELNIKHYRNSADYEESTFLVGQPMVNVSGVSQQWIDDNYPDGINFGSRQCLMTPPNADIKIVQASPNTMALEGMRQKEDQMAKIGARFITPGSGVETAEAARIRHGADMSILHVLVKNANQAYNDAILVVELFMGTTEDFVFEINDDFYTSGLNPQLLQGVVSAWQSGALTDETLLIELEKLGIDQENMKTDVQSA